MASNYDGLTRNVWPGTWSTGTNSPIVLDTEVRGTLQSISGDASDRLTDIPGARIQEGMLVYVKNTYTAGSYTRTGDKYYTYKLQGSEVRSNITGAVPNAEANWSLFSSGGGAGYTGSAGAIGFTGSVGAIGYSGSKGDVGYSGSKGDQGNKGYTGSIGDDGAIGYSGSKGDLGYTGSKGDSGAAGAVGYTGSKGDIGSVGFTGSKGSDGGEGPIGYTGSKGDIGSVGFTGSKGTAGTAGAVGYVGSKGDLGYTGSIGYSGSKGDQGIIGYTGSEGNLDVAVASTPPGSAGIGDVWIDDATGIQYFYMNDGNSNQWVELANSGIVGFTGSTGTVGFTGSAGSGGSSITAGNSSVSVADTGTDGEVTFRTEGTDRWDITNSGHLLPVAHETYDIGSADRKVRHLFLSDNSLKMGANEVSIGLTNDKLTIAGSHITTSEYETKDNTGALDITKRNHFITAGINYTLADGTYIGQELLFYKSGITTSTYSDITVANAKVVIIGTGATELRTSHNWRLDTTGGVFANTFSCIWDGQGWCLNGGTIGA